jgi:hypothetical protein
MPSYQFGVKTTATQAHVRTGKCSNGQPSAPPPHSEVRVLMSRSKKKYRVPVSFSNFR